MTDPMTTLALGAVLADGGSDGDPRTFGLLLLLSGFIFYGYVYLRYRNSDKRHLHESETASELHDVRGDDRFSRKLTGLSNSRMERANNHAVRGAQNGSLNGLLGTLSDELKRFQ